MTISDGLSASAQAVIAWINTFDCVSPPISSLQELSNGNVFGKILNKIDPNWFRPRPEVNPTESWVNKFHNLARLYKDLVSYYQTRLNKNTEGFEFDTPNLQMMARGDMDQTLRLSHFILALSVQVENNTDYVNKIQNMSHFDQHEIMVAIQSVISCISNQQDDGYIEPNTPYDPYTPRKHPIDYESLQKSMQSQLDALQARNDELAIEKREAESRITQLEQTVTQFQSAGNVDGLLRSQIDKLSNDLASRENQCVELESTIAMQTQKLTDLTKKLEQSAYREEEMMRLKDQLDEFRHAADKLQKTEAILDKYRKRADESHELRRTVKMLEERLDEKDKRITSLQDENLKSGSLKTLVDAYKDQIKTLEEKSSALQMSNVKLTHELSAVKSKCERYEAEHLRDQEMIQQLSEKVDDMELSGVVRVGGSADGDKMDATDASQLKDEIARARARDTKRRSIFGIVSDDSGVVDSLKNQIEDEKRLRAKMEDDYRLLLEKNLGLESEIRQLQMIQDGNVGDPALLIRLQEAEEEIERLKVSQSAADAHGSSTMSKGKQSASTSTSVGGDGNNSDGVQLKTKIDQLSRENTTQSIRINHLLSEKESLQQTVIELKEQIQQLGRVNSELRSKIAAMQVLAQPSSQKDQELASATHYITALKDQNAAYQESVKKTREHITLLNKRISELESMTQTNTYAEAIESFKQTIRMKEMEVERAKQEVADTRASAKREIRLMASAWYSMSIRHAQLGALASDGGVNVVNKPKSSWLGQQRQS